MTSVSHDQPSAGSVLDGYQLLTEVGSGSCGHVFRAKNLLSGEIFALKIFPGQGSLAERELEAVKLYQKIEHPNLIRIHHVGQTGSQLFYTMDWCECSLAQRKVPPEELLEIAKKLTSALASLHEHDLIHRDIKPDNIFFRNGEAVLGDIGLVTRQESATFAGSPGFLAPALLNGKAKPDRYTDCYALAKTLYCSLSGRDPGKFPYYDGPLSEAASIILRAAMAVCSDEPEIRDTAELARFLGGQSLPAPRRHRKYLLPAVLLGAALLMLMPFLTRRLVSAVPAEHPTDPAPTVKRAKAKPSARRETKTEPKPKKQTPPGNAVPDFPKVRRSFSPLKLAERQRLEETGRISEYAEEVDRANDWFTFLDWLKKHHADRTYREKYAAYLPTIKDPAKRNESQKLHSELCASGVGADTLSLYRDHDRMELWQRAGIEWERKRKWQCLEELLRCEKETGLSPDEILRDMAEHDPFLQFFGLDQRQWLALRTEATLLSSRKNEPLQREYRKATEKYVRQREAFLDWFKKQN